MTWIAILLLVALVVVCCALCVDAQRRAEVQAREREMTMIRVASDAERLGRHDGAIAAARSGGHPPPDPNIVDGEDSEIARAYLRGYRQAAGR